MWVHEYWVDKLLQAELTMTMKIKAFSFNECTTNKHNSQTGDNVGTSRDFNAPIGPQ